MQIAALLVSFEQVRFSSSLLLIFGAKFFLTKLPTGTIRSGDKINKLKIHERKPYNICISVDGAGVKTLASKFLLIL